MKDIGYSPVRPHRSATVVGGCRRSSRDMGAFQKTGCSTAAGKSRQNRMSTRVNCSAASSTDDGKDSKYAGRVGLADRGLKRVGPLKYSSNPVNGLAGVAISQGHVFGSSPRIGLDWRVS